VILRDRALTCEALAQCTNPCRADCVSEACSDISGDDGPKGRPGVLYRFGQIIVIPAAMDAWVHHIGWRRAAGIEAVLRDARVRLPGVRWCTCRSPPAVGTARVT
jgi:hypothetical protein